MENHLLQPRVRRLPSVGLSGENRIARELLCRPLPTIANVHYFDRHTRHGLRDKSQAGEDRRYSYGGLGRKPIHRLDAPVLRGESVESPKRNDVVRVPDGILVVR
jgi:hypothetical protein